MSTLLELPDLMQGTDEWMEQRRGIVTASTVGNLITLGRLTAIDFDCPACDAPSNEPCRSKTKAGAPIKTLHSERASVARNTDSNIVFETANNDTSRALTATLVAERITGWTVDMFISDDMYRGIEDEPKARDTYSTHYSPVVETGFMVRQFDGFKIGYSPDGLVGDNGLIEAKSRHPKKHLETILSGYPPRENMAQLQCGLLVSGREWIDYLSYCGGMPMWVKRVYPDQRWFDAITAAVAAFESDADAMIAAYNTAIAGFPTTTRELTEIRF